MRDYFAWLQYHHAAGTLLLLAALLLAACTQEEPPVAQSTASPTPTATPRPIQTSTATPRPTETPTATPNPTLPVSGPAIHETTISLLTYPIRDYLVEQLDPVYNMPVFYFNRPAFEAANPTPTTVDYSGVVLENTYLRLTFLPELGGRLYSAVVKATGQEVFYHNPVVKPSRYGVLQPPEANWWLATGGMEWAYPTQEHGYRWGVPWSYETGLTGEGAVIHLSDTGPDQVRATVTVTLPHDSAFFTIAPRLVNAGPESVPVQFWLNAALALAPGSMSPRTRFIAPVEEIVVHSRGADEGWAIPDARQSAPWPQVGPTDLREYSQWANYLGFFVPNMKAPFIGAYNPDTDLGIARLVEPGTVPGNKLFAFGVDFPDRSYTTDDSQSCEIWGGATTGFWAEEDIDLPPGQAVAWQESWWPLAHLGGLTWANRAAALHVAQADGEYTLSLLVSRPRQGELSILSGQAILLSEQLSADPAEPVRRQVPAASGPIQIQFKDTSGQVLLEHVYTLQ